MRAAGLLAMLAPAACVREPAEAVCPELAEGELVVTEVRGPQASDDDTLGAWVELYNASGRTIDLLGVKIRLRGAQDDEDGGIPILVRRSLRAEAGSFIVLGMFDDVDPPPHVDYGFLADFSAILQINGGAVHVESCGAQIDRVTEHIRLPATGTYSLGGAPDADRNDSGSFWCTDATPIGATFPGTPKTQNITCP